MNDINDFMDRVAAEANPPAVYNRANAQDMEDYILLSDLVESEAHLPASLKREFLDVMVEDHGEGEPSSDVILEMVEDFAAMDPVVDLESLGGGRETAA
ncbi:hypothetical protein PQI66_09840 [Corynebacterium sp. USCH3]|uniref:hypothetical protein n=1 Tax=Corynebacterium sp. USCH3 TaxID=3024840 RepID=UPI0030981290